MSATDAQMAEFAEADRQYGSVNAVVFVEQTGRDPYTRVLIVGDREHFTIVPAFDGRGGWEFTRGYGQNAPAGPDGYPVHEFATLAAAIEATRKYW
jgi:hypothetical protein